MNRLDMFSDEQFINIVNSSSCMSDIRRKLGYGTNGRHSSILIENRACLLGIKIPNEYKNSFKNKPVQKPIEKVFVENSTYLCTDHLKNKIRKYNLIDYRCSICGNEGVWNGNQLSLQIHHINGKHNDNRIQNLCFLCPNCHSQTDSYAGKGQRRAKQDKQS